MDSFWPVEREKRVDTRILANRIAVIFRTRQTSVRKMLALRFRRAFLSALLYCGVSLVDNPKHSKLLTTRQLAVWSRVASVSRARLTVAGQVHNYGRNKWRRALGQVLVAWCAQLAAITLLHHGSEALDR